MSHLFPDKTKLLSANLKGCSAPGDRVIIETKRGTVEGMAFERVGTQYRFKYNAVDAGYYEGHELSPCDVVGIRCYSCCDDRWIEAEDCSPLTREKINALVGPKKPVGQLYIYSGDQEEPDCVWKYKGLGDHQDPSNWVVFNDEITQYSGDKLTAFLNWLADLFTGNVTFNADPSNGQIIVSAAGGAGGGHTATFTIKYQDGQVLLDPGDGSAPKTLNLVTVDGKPPTAPYNWFLYVDASSNTAFINTNGTPMLIGQVTPDQLMTCDSVAACLSDNLLNRPDPDQYYVPGVLDNVIVQVVYNDGSNKVAEFIDCSAGASDLDDLVNKLNSCANNPAGWRWVNSGGTLVLCVPSSYAVSQIIYDDYQVINYDEPSVYGSGGVDLCAAVQACARESGAGFAVSEYDQEANIENIYGGDQYASVLWVGGGPVLSVKNPIFGWVHAPVLTVSAKNLHTDVEADFVGQSYAQVRWTHVLGIPYLSYKDPVNGWHHQPLWGEFNCGGSDIWVETLDHNGPIDKTRTYSASTTTGIANPATNWPVGVRGLRVKLQLTKNSGTAGSDPVTGRAYFDGGDLNRSAEVRMIGNTGTGSAILTGEGVIMRPNNQTVAYSNVIRFHFARGGVSGDYELRYITKSLIF